MGEIAGDSVRANICNHCLNWNPYRIDSRSQSVVLLSDFEDLILLAKVFNPVLRDANICHQLALFGIAAGPSLPSAEYRGSYTANSGEESEYADRVVKPMFLITTGVFAVGAGIWLMYFAARRRGLSAWALGAAILALGWISSVFGGIWLLAGRPILPSKSSISHSDNASASPGSYRVSATTYGRPEDVGVVPIIIAPICPLNDASDNASLALGSADDGEFPNAAGSEMLALRGMFVFLFSSDVGFVNLDDAHKLAKVWVGETGSNAMAHIERRRIGAEADCAMNLQRGNAFLRGQHHMNDAEPNAHSDLSIFEDRTDKHGEPIAASLGASATLPMEGLIGDGVHVSIVAARATDALWPARGNEIGLTGVIIREKLLELSDGHLTGELRHGSNSLV